MIESSSLGSRYKKFLLSEKRRRGRPGAVDRMAHIWHISGMYIDCSSPKQSFYFMSTITSDSAEPVICCCSLSMFFRLKLRLSSAVIEKPRNVRYRLTLTVVSHTTVGYMWICRNCRPAHNTDGQVLLTNLPLNVTSNLRRSHWVDNLWCDQKKAKKRRKSVRP